MTDARDPDSPSNLATGAVGPQAKEAFSLLGNETRLAILIALWEAYDPHADDNTLSFSEIFERVDYDDPGSFSYHLRRLEGHFIRRHAEDEGYELRIPGRKFVQVVIAGAGVRDEFEATEIDQPCPFCDAPTAISYREGLVVQVCTRCEGVTTEETDAGFLSAVPFDPAGLADRTPGEIRAASRIAAWRQAQLMFDGLCPACSGGVDSWLDPCPDHDPTGICGTCGTKFPVWVRFQCRVCKNHNTSSPKALALFHPAVLGFYNDHGVSTRLRADDESVRRVFDLMDDHDLEAVSTEPPRAEVTVALPDDEIRLTFDETATVVDVSR